MKPYLIFFSLVLLFFKMDAQNLVKNPSFEEYWFCPYLADFDTFPCKNWIIPNFGSPDYLNLCGRDGYSTVPLNLCGYNPANTGNSYVGLILMIPESGYTEHIQGEITEPLIKGKKYKVSFFVRYPYLASYFSTYAIGAYLSSNRILTKNYNDDNYFINNRNSRFLNSCWYFDIFNPKFKAHIENNSDKFLDEENTWTEVQGNYIAKGGEKYITIGLFWQDNPISNKIFKKYFTNNSLKYKNKMTQFFLREILHKNPKRKVENNVTFENCCYYFIDDVSVIPLDSAGNEMQKPINK